MEEFPLEKALYRGGPLLRPAPRFGIPDLMRWIVIGNVAVYVLMLLTMRADANALSFLYLDGSKVLRGEIWRIITFIFVPASSSPFWLAISLYFYYWIAPPWSASGAPPASTSTTGAASC